MRTFVATAAAVAMGLVCPAFADTHVEIGTGDRPDAGPSAPTLWLGTPTEGATISRVRLAVSQHASETHAKLSFVIATGRAAREVETSLEVPHDAQVVGLSLRLGDGPRVVGQALAARDAGSQYRQLLSGNRDPALLELASMRAGVDRMTLHAFPVTEKTPATVELEIVLPAVRAIAIDSSQRIDSLAVEIDGLALPAARFDDARRIELPAPRPNARVTGPVSRTAVDEAISLFVGQPPGAVPQVQIGIVIGCGFGHSVGTRTVDKKTIRTEVRRHLDQLRYCYSRQLQQQQTLAGKVALHFLIGRDGKIAEASVDGDLDSEEVKRCMRDQVVQWQFHEQDSATQVNYPLTLVNEY